jgi:tetratricopeptide (TPR) repeat protein
LSPHLLLPDAKLPRAERLQRSREMLLRALSLETTIAFVGSGCSVPLGYPTWRELALSLVRATLGQHTDNVRCQNLEARLSKPPSGRPPRPAPTSEEMMFAISVCRQILGEEEYMRRLKEALQAKPTTIACNPHDALLGLPIYRFITTNYDLEIENALAKKRRIEHPRSFTQKPQSYDQLALFALAEVEEARNLVFHCHGRIDQEDSIIATEADYQKWYLAESPEGIAFRQTIDLLLGSNPILFVGYGLGDEDLLRPLRLFHAVSSEERYSRPLFALLSEEKDGKDWDHHEFLFERYGLNVIPFPAKPKERGAKLCHELRCLAEQRLVWWESWIDKPFFRQVSLSTVAPAPYRHFGPIPHRGGIRQDAAGSSDLLSKDQVEHKVNEIAEVLASGKARVLVLLGTSGTGKSLHALRLMDRLAARPKAVQPPFEGFFFWSSSYSDDILTGIDALLCYIDREERKETSRLDQLQRKLREKRCLIIFDGFDRLLHPTDRADVGMIESRPAHKFLDLFLDPGCRSTLLITSRLWPCELDGRDGVVRIPVERQRFDATVKADLFGGAEDAQVFYALFDGHAYALALASRYCRRRSGESLEVRARRLRQALFGISPEGRIWRLIHEIVDELDRETGGSASLLLERLAIFMTPITGPILEICRAEAEKAHGTRIADSVIDKLTTSHLVFRAHCGAKGSSFPIWTVHPKVRSYVFEQIHRVNKDALPHYTLSGFTSGDASVHPGLRGAKTVHDLWESLYGKAETALQEPQGIQKAGELCRALFGVMRSRMEANTIPRWWTYRDYARLGLRLIDLVKRVSALAGLPFWSYCEPTAIDRIQCENAPLHADEMAWLYNEVGLTLVACGHMAECLAVWEQGYAINLVIDGTTPVPSYTLQSQLHLVHAFLDLGRLPVMRSYLDEAERTNEAAGEPDATGRILGFRALLAHLQGNFSAAERLYRKALKELRKSGNTRAESYFLSHRTALDVSLGQLDRAEEAAQSCRALAETSGYPDLVTYSRLASGRVCRAQGKLVDATVELNAALLEATRLGLGRFQAEILAELAFLALDLGDTALARSRAIDALQISNKQSLGLRRSHSLLILGLATIKAEQRDLGIAYLKQAKKIAQSQEYWLCSREADERLEKMGEGDRPSSLPADPLSP